MNPHDNLLLVEDDPAIAALMRQHLEQAGYAVRHESDGAVAAQVLQAHSFDLVLLDLGLPGTDGWDLCRQLRATQGRYTPLIIVSARSAEAHRVLGLELGADDYLAKPFSMLELVARVRALLRRAHALREASPQDTPLRLGRLLLDTQRRELRQGSTAVPLALREYDLLRFLARHPGRPFSRAELLARVWGDGFDGYEHTVNSHINRLRSKLAADPEAAGLIETVWGVGYRFRAAAVEAAP
jgi:DNA-binding response OmpR family regulator